MNGGGGPKRGQRGAAAIAKAEARFARRGAGWAGWPAKEWSGGGVAAFQLLLYLQSRLKASLCVHAQGAQDEPLHAGRNGRIDEMGRHKRVIDGAGGRVGRDNAGQQVIECG